jgi:hypothetical protein
MRPQLLLGSCLLAALLLALSIRGAWGRATGDDGATYEIGLRKIVVMIPADTTDPAVKHYPRMAACDYLRGRGAVQFCAPVPEADAAFSMLCAAFPLLVLALVFALASAAVTKSSPYTGKGTAAALAGAGFAASFAATVFAKISMPYALAVLLGPKMEFSGLPFVSAWLAVALLLFAAGIGTTSTMLGHT